MSTKEDQALIGRAMMEPEFRSRLLKNPEATAKAEGLTVSPELIAQLKKLDAKQAAQVGNIIGAVFGQKELSDAQLEKAAGGGLVSQAQLASRLPDLLSQAELSKSKLPPGGLTHRAPTTW